MSVGDLGDCLYLENGTLTPLLKRMERGGFITRRRDPEDERRVLITLTAHGLDLRSDAKAVPERLSRRLDLDESAIVELRDSVKSLVRILSSQKNSASSTRSHSAI
jgi:DNA-binding MarR family transcriptional regulator